MIYVHTNYVYIKSVMSSGTNVINISFLVAKIGEDLMPSLSRDDIKDLFPGPENFERRRALWLVANKDEKVSSALYTVS